MKILSLATVTLCLFANAALAAQQFKGTWEVIKSVPAPWLAVRKELTPYHNEQLDRAKLVFADDKLTAPISQMSCDNPKYTVSVVTFSGLFGGGLEDKKRGMNDAAGEAHKLGFTREPVLSLSTSCGEFVYHFADNNTMLFTLGNKIYTLTRVNP